MPANGILNTVCLFLIRQMRQQREKLKNPSWVEYAYSVFAFDFLAVFSECSFTFKAKKAS